MPSGELRRPAHGVEFEALRGHGRGAPRQAAAERHLAAHELALGVGYDVDAALETPYRDRE